MINASKNNLNEALVRYASDRNKSHSLVGQFLDGEGRNNPQFGVYGMADWLYLTHNTAIMNNEDVRFLRNECAKKLIDWSLPYKDLTDEEFTEKIRSHNEIKYIKDLWRVVPKICCAISGLERFNDHEVITNSDKLNAILALKDRLLSIKSGYKFWSFTSESSVDVRTEYDSLIISTCYVLDSFANSTDGSLNESLREGIDYVRTQLSTGKNNLDILKKLYVYNTLQQTKHLHQKDYSQNIMVELKNFL